MKCSNASIKTCSMGMDQFICHGQKSQMKGHYYLIIIKSTTVAIL